MKERGRGVMNGPGQRIDFPPLHFFQGLGLPGAVLRLRQGLLGSEGDQEMPIGSRLNPVNGPGMLSPGKQRLRQHGQQSDHPVDFQGVILDRPEDASTQRGNHEGAGDPHWELQEGRQPGMTRGEGHARSKGMRGRRQ